jgi:hypothetical protein
VTYTPARQAHASGGSHDYYNIAFKAKHRQISY